MAKKKVDPLNRKYYQSVIANLTVGDVKAAAAFYQKALGFKKRALMNGPDGKPMHAEFTLRGTTLMVGPEFPQYGARSPKSLGGSPVGLYVYVENADKAVAKAIKMGATATVPVMDMFWGDRCGTVLDPDGHKWTLATHNAEPTPKEMKKKMKEQFGGMAAQAGG